MVQLSSSLGPLASDALGRVALQHRLHDLYFSMVKGDVIPPNEIDDLCQSLHDFDFYEFAKAELSFLRNRDDERLRSDDPVMIRLLEAAKAHLPIPIVPPFNGTPNAALAQRYASVQFQLAQQGSAEGKLGPVMLERVSEGFAGTFEALGVTAPDRLAPYRNIDELHRVQPSKTIGFHPRSKAQPSTTVTETGLRNGGQTCYQNAIFSMLLFSEQARNALAILPASSEDPRCEVLKEMFTHLQARRLDESVAALERWWALNKELGAKWQQGHQQDAEEFLGSLNEILGKSLFNIWQFATVPQYQCLACDRSGPGPLASNLVFDLHLPTSDDTSLGKLLAQSQLQYEIVNKRCDNLECPSHGAPDQVHSAVQQLQQTPQPTEMIFRAVRFNFDASSGRCDKNRALIQLPQWIFPVPGQNRLYYIKAIVVHQSVDDRNAINSGHYLTYVREGPAEAEGDEAEMDSAEMDAAEMDAAEMDAAEMDAADAAVGLASINLAAVDEDTTLDKSTTPIKKTGPKRSFQDWKSYEDDVLKANVPWSVIEKHLSNWYLILAVPVDDKDVGILREEVAREHRDQLRLAVRNALQNGYNKHRQRFEAAVEPAMTILLLEYFKSIGSDLAELDEEELRANAPNIGFGFAVFSKFEWGSTPEPEQSSSTLRNFIRIHGLELLSEAFNTLSISQRDQNDKTLAKELWQFVVDGFGKVVLATAPEWIESQMHASASTALQKFTEHDVVEYEREEKEKAEQRAEMAEQTRRRQKHAAAMSDEDLAATLSNVQLVPINKVLDMLDAYSSIHATAGVQPTSESVVFPPIRTPIQAAVDKLPSIAEDSGDHHDETGQQDKSSISSPSDLINIDLSDNDFIMAEGQRKEDELLALVSSPPAQAQQDLFTVQPSNAAQQVSLPQSPFDSWRKTGEVPDSDSSQVPITPIRNIHNLTLRPSPSRVAVHSNQTESPLHSVPRTNASSTRRRRSSGEHSSRPSPMTREGLLRSGSRDIGGNEPSSPIVNRRRGAFRERFLRVARRLRPSTSVASLPSADARKLDPSGRLTRSKSTHFGGAAPDLDDPESLLRRPRSRISMNFSHIANRVLRSPEPRASLDEMVDTAGDAPSSGPIVQSELDTADRLPPRTSSRLSAFLRGRVLRSPEPRASLDEMVDIAGNAPSDDSPIQSELDTADRPPPRLSSGLSNIVVRGRNVQSPQPRGSSVEMAESDGIQARPSDDQANRGN